MPAHPLMVPAAMREAGDVDMCAEETSIGLCESEAGDLQHGEDEDLEIDSEDIWSGVVHGLPIPEHTLLSKECVKGRQRPFATGRSALLRDLARSNPRLLEFKLSHLAEGVYDVERDADRFPSCDHEPELMHEDISMEIDTPLFLKRGVAAATDHRRRITPDE